MTNRIHALLSEYGESHRNPANKLIHWICVPLIVISLLGILWTVDVPEIFQRSKLQLNWAMLLIPAAMVYYLLLSLRLATGILIVLVPVLVLISWIDRTSQYLWLISVVVFVLAWTGQFIGHKLEGAKPSFFKDLQFLLIGPLWLLSFLYRKLGIKY